MALTHTPYSVYLLTSHCISLSSSYSDATSHAVEITGTIAGVVVVLVLLTLLGLTAGVSIGVVLARRAQKKGMSPQRKGGFQRSSGNAGIGRAAAEEEGAEDHTYDAVDDDTSINGREVLYQGLVLGTQDCVSVYTQLRGGTYQELDTWGREEEHHYQQTNQGK